eukprot:6165284-Amphidinium_carterae.1
MKRKHPEQQTIRNGNCIQKSLSYRIFQYRNQSERPGYKCDGNDYNNYCNALPKNIILLAIFS